MLSNKFKGTFKFVPLLIISVFISVSTKANNSQTLNDINNEVVSAIKLIKAKDFSKACSVLNSIYDAKLLSESVESNKQIRLNVFYLLGQCYAGLGLYDQAQEHLKQVVVSDPNEPRPYLDLALIYQYMGEYQQANEQFDFLLSMKDLTPALRDKVERFSKNSPDALQYYVNFTGGIISDSNINNAPIVDSITIYDQNFIFNTDLRPLDSAGVNLGVQAQVSKLLSKTSYVSGQIDFTSTSFGDFSSQDSTVLDLSAAYNSKIWNGEYSIQPRFATVSIGGSPLLSVIGIDAGYSSLWQEDLRVNTKVGYQQYSYSDDDERSVGEIKGEILFNYRLFDNLFLYTNLGYSIGSASEDIYSYSDIIIKLGADYSFTSNLLLSASYKINSTSYSGEIAGFGETRSDSRSALNVNASYNLGKISNILRRVTLDAGVNIYSNTSNIELFENERDQTYLLFNIAL